MRFATAVVSAFVLVLVGCGGSKQAGAPASATERRDAGVFEERTADNGMPGWVNRGNAAVVKEDGRRVFYGVSSASGIKNPSLLRSTADNRARNELAKVFEVFSASLMKDYMSSTGEQNVEQAIKTATSASLKGVEIVDRYIAQDGSMYALAALDLKKAMELIAAAESSGAVKSYVQKVEVDDIFDQHGKKPAPPPPPPKVAANEETQSGTGSAGSSTPPSSGAKARTGAKPAWVDGHDPSFPWRDYLCGVGFGGQRSIAESGAYAALSRIFVSRVQSVSQDFMGAYSKTGAQSLEMQSSETLTKISTEKIFSGVYIAEVWEDGKGTAYALACLERAKAARVLAEQIAAADARAGKHLSTAEGADKATQLRELARALEAIVEREVLNGELRIVDADGVGISGPYAHVDVAAAFEGVQQALRIGVKADGPYAEDFRGALVEGLTKRGYLVTDLSSGEDGELDVLIAATIRIEDGGKGTGSAASTHFARGVIQVEVKNVGQAKVIAAMNESRKEGHRSKDEAERRVVRQLGSQLVSKVGGKIDAAMKGR